MTTQRHALTQAGAGASVLAGADVCAAAGFRLRPAGRAAMFDDDTWRFGDVEGLSVQMSRPASTRLDFTAISDPRWRLAAKEYVFARLAPGHPEIAVLPRAFRVPLTLPSCLKRLSEVTRWMNWLTAQRVPSLGDVTQDHCDRYLAERRLRKDAAGTVIGSLEESVARVAAAAVIELASYGELLSADRYRDGFTPWNGRSSSQVAGMRPPAENKTPVVSQEILQPLLAAALYMTATVAPHLVMLPPQVRQRRQDDARLGEAVPDPGLIKEALRRHARDGEPLEAVRDVTARARLHQGWNPDDPLLSVSFTALAREAGTGRIRPAALAAIRPLIEQAVAAVGTAKPWGRQAGHVPLAGGTGTTPWTLPLDERDIRDLTGYAHTACLLLTAALTGMRGSELMELRHGCRSTSRHGDGMTRYRIKSKLIKGQPLGGTGEEWVVIEAVYDAIGMAEQLSRLIGVPGDLVFGRFNFEPRYPWFRDWVNGPAGQRLGLTEIPDAIVTLRMLRRTLAHELAYRPGGLLAAKIALKHVSVATTEGYAARPGGAQGKLLAEIAEDEADRNLQTVLAEFRNYQDGIMPAGPGARELTEFFASIDKDLAGREPAAPRVVASDQHVLNLLSKRAQVLHLTASNFCWFTEPSRALCLKMAGTPAADKPLECATRHAARRPPTTPATGPSGPRPSPAPPHSSARSAAPGKPSASGSRPNSTAPSASWTPSTPPQNETKAAMRTTAEQRRQAEQRIRAAADALLRGDIPPDGKCDITTLARQAGVSRAALYRSYPHLKEDFERRLAAVRPAGNAPDPRDAQIARLKTRNDELRMKLAGRDEALRDLEQFKVTAISRLAAQHDEIIRLRRQAASAAAGNVRSLTPRLNGGADPARQETS